MNTKRIASFFLASSLVVLAACGGKDEKPAPKVPTKAGPGGTAPAPELSKDAQVKFNAALDAFIEHDKANNWNDDACKDVASQFESVGNVAQATFNAGLSYQRCNDDKNARARFEKALQQDSKFHHARAQIALYDYKKDGNEDAAINSLQQAVNDAQFQNVPALVNLGMVMMERDGANAGQGCKDDMDCAKLNLQRALAIDDAYMPAFNQLALYYFKLAKKRAGAVKGSSKSSKGRHVITHAAIGKRADVQQLELAALVCSQAIRKNANYAPIHNTAGLIQNELGQVNGAVSEFAAAAKLDPKFFEAQMNFAFVNLGFRGFEQAQAAFKKALEMRPNDYDAHLGMALAIRGPITGAENNYDQLVASAQGELDAAKKIDPNRPDAYYNEGILTQEFKAKSGMDKEKTKAALRDAAKVFNTFLEKAAGKPEYDGAVKRVKGDGNKDLGRLGDIDDTIKFLDLDVGEQKAQGTPGGNPTDAKPAEGGGAAPPAGGDAKPADPPKK